VCLARKRLGVFSTRKEARMVKILSNIEIGEKLKNLRNKAGYTQERLSEVIGVSRNQLQKYERGQDALSPEKLQQLANALSVPVQEFFMSSEEALPLDTAEKLLLDSFRAIPNKEIQESILKITTNATRQ
jgi:transcriptional regulator with XRE-family HTH domain